MLVLTRNIGQKICIGDDIILTVTKIGNNFNQVSIGIDAPKSVRIFREEVYNKRQAENQHF